MAFKVSFTGKITERLRDILLGDKGRKLLIAAALAAMLLLLFSTFSCGGRSEKVGVASQTEDAAVLEKTLEERITRLVSRIDGVGDPSKIEVMITLDTSSTRIYEKDRRYEITSRSGENGGTENNVGETEVVLAGNSKEPLQIGTVQPTVRGATVVCSGAADPLVCERVTYAVAKALNVGVSRVYITY